MKELINFKYGNHLDVHLPEPEYEEGPVLPVVVVPGARKVLLHDGWRAVVALDLVHAVLLAPDHGLGEHLASLLDVEVARAQEPVINELRLQQVLKEFCAARIASFDINYVLKVDSTVVPHYV